MTLTRVPVEAMTFLVVGVDFGTTYTGVAYTLSDDPDPSRITVITKWPGAGTQNRPKVPTEIAYEPSGSRWGWQLKPGSPRYSGFKLLLDPTASAHAYNDEQLAVTLDSGNPAMQSSLRPGKSATEMTSDYLQLVHKKVMQELKTRFPATLDNLKIKFIITTPAMWSPAAQHNTKMAAKAAGFGGCDSRPHDMIELVTEPEAAASYTLKDINSLLGRNSGIQDTSAWQVGSQVIMCDAGGGTVDLVSYVIDQVEPYLRVSETTSPRGGLCGATSLDYRFLDLIKQRLGRQAHLLDAAHGGRGSLLMASFNELKHNFGSNDFEDDELVSHGIPNLATDLENGIDAEYVTLTYEDMKSIFDPVVDKIEALAKSVSEEARMKSPSKPLVRLILVGGFGESIYLLRRLTTWGQAQNPPIIVCNPRKSWSAIAQGAVCFGLEGIVHGRILPCHYGVEIGEPYNESIHDPAYNYVREFDGSIYNCDTITWFAKMGERSDRENRIKVPFVCSTRDRFAKIPLSLRTCRYDDPPKSRRDARILHAPKITIDLSFLPALAFKTKKVGGFWIFGTHTAYASFFTLEMVTGSASFKFEIRHNGELLATQDVDPQFVGVPRIS